jgi:Mg2+ and Co2+ transporter CorA
MLIQFNLGTFWLKIEQLSIMMSFLTYITGFFMNFELLPILTDYAH